MAVRSACSLLNLSTVKRKDISRNSLKPTGEAGFSVIELMLVVTIIGIASTLAVLSYRATLPTSRLRQATTELYSAIALAKVSAMSQNSTMTLQLTGASSVTSGADVTVTGTDIAPVTITVNSAAGTAVIPHQPLTPEVVSVTVSPGTTGPLPRVQFNSYGMHVGGNTQLITLRNTQGKIYSISVAPSGKANFCLAATCS